MVFAKDIKQYGITKISLVIICLLIFGFFVSFIFNGFLDIGTELCNRYTPFFSCNGIYNFFAGIGATAVAIIGPLFAYNALIKLQMWKLGLIAIIVLLASLIGTFVLKYRYEKLISSK